MTQHTPGPWTAYQSQNEQGAPIPRWRIHGPDLCGPFVTIDIDITTETCAKQDANLKANAALIAAAPDLLEALTAIVARFEGKFDDPALMKHGPLKTNTATDMWAIAKLAIAKAEGRAS